MPANIKGPYSLNESQIVGPILMDDSTTKKLIVRSSNGNNLLTCVTSVSGNSTLNVCQSSGSAVNVFQTSAVSCFSRDEGLVLGALTASAVSSAQLTMISTTRCFLPPRMTTAQMNAVASPTPGDICFNTDLQQICVYVTGKWQKVTQTDV